MNNEFNEIVAEVVSNISTEKTVLDLFALILHGRIQAHEIINLLEKAMQARICEKEAQGVSRGLFGFPEESTLSEIQAMREFAKETSKEANDWYSTIAD